MTEVPENNRRFEGLKIMYVDDETDNLDGFELNLDGRFETLVDDVPENALRRIRKEPELAVLVVDQVMPKMDGLTLAKAARELHPNLVCIMITGNATKQLAIESVRSQIFFEFLEKPVDFASESFYQLLVAAVQNHLLNRLQHEYREGTIELLATLIDDKDGHTHRHSQRVTEWAIKLGKEMALSERELMKIHEGALLHDIGKISIPDDILKKPGRLTELERKIIMTHPQRGGELLEKIPQLAELACMARDHHERPDGKGYPRGLKGDEIELLAQIVSMADFFEALSSHRPYKQPWAIKDIVREVASVRGTQFRNDVVDALFRVIQCEGLLDADEISEVCRSIAA